MRQHQLALVFTLFFSFVLSCKGDLAEALNPLFKPNIASARVAVENLSKLGCVDKLKTLENQ